MDIVKTERAFGIKLASGENCAPGILIKVNSSGEGVVADNSTPKKPHGVSLTSGAGTKVAGISQYVNCYRSATVYDENNFGITIVPGAVIYCIDGGLYDDSAPGVTDYKVGFALDANTMFIDLDVSQL